MAHGSRHQFGQAVEDRQVGLQHQRAALAPGFQFVGQTVHVGGRVPVMQRHVAAVGMQPAGDRGADATGGAGDEDDTTRRGHGRLRNRSPHSPCFAPEWRKTAPKNVSRSSRRWDA